MSTDNIVKCAGDEQNKPQKFLILFIIGFFIIFVGIIILMIATALYGRVQQILEASYSYGLFQ